MYVRFAMSNSCVIKISYSVLGRVCCSGVWWCWELRLGFAWSNSHTCRKVVWEHARQNEFKHVCARTPLTKVKSQLNVLRVRRTPWTRRLKVNYCCSPAEGTKPEHPHIPGRGGGMTAGDPLMVSLKPFFNRSFYNAYLFQS